MRSALETNYSPPVTRQEVYRFSWPVSDEGRIVKLRIVSGYPKATYRFWYPSFNIEQQAQHTATFNLSGGLRKFEGHLYEYDNSSTKRSEIETNFIRLHNDIVTRKKEQLKNKLERVGTSEDEISKRLANFQFKVSFGVGSTVYGCQAVVDDKEVRSVEIKATTMNPKRNKYRAPEFEVGIQQIFSLVEDDKLVYPPFLTQIQIKSKLSKYTARNASYLIYIPEPVVAEEFKKILPASFRGCVWVHPDDADLVISYIKESNQIENIGKNLPVPYYKDYPDENGTLIFVSRQLDPEIVEVKNIYDIDKTLTQEIIEKIANRRNSFEFDPSTQESLLGGHYVEDPRTGRFIFLSNEEIEQAKTDETDEEGNIIVDLAKIGKGDFSASVREYTGKLVKSPFNPFFINNEGDLIWSDAEEIAELAESYGIPVYRPGQYDDSSSEGVDESPPFDVDPDVASKPVANVVYSGKSEEDNQSNSEIPAMDI